ncbi:MAG: putative glycoside hydrolase, family, partial [Bacteroidetes bacterium]|nr:putative glycoside hydrolase, family [Bacteroidota bacterium]
MKKGLFVFTLFCLFVNVKIFCQVGSTCGIPTWYASVQYSNLSVVEHNGIIYKSTQWSTGAEPGKGGEWTSLGTCNEQLIINNPGLAYTACAKVNDWNSSTPNYNTGDLVRFNSGVYKANYWVAGTEYPDRSAAYTYLGVCVIPIDISPSYADGQLIILSSLTAVNLTAAINTHSFTLASSKIEIKKVTATTYTTYSTTVS